MDVEFVVADDRVLLVQARPETVWRARVAASPATGPDRPASALGLILSTLTAPGTAGSASPVPPSRA
jgi:hypothetical protein